MGSAVRTEPVAGTGKRFFTGLSWKNPVQRMPEMTPKQTFCMLTEITRGARIPANQIKTQDGGIVRASHPFYTSS